MPSEQTDVDGVPEYGDNVKKCVTCGMAAHECRLQDIPEVRARENPSCWRAPGIHTRRPKDMVCVLGRSSSGAHCRGSRCYLWSKLGPEEVTGVPGTCMVALALAEMCVDARHGIAMEEGEDS